MSQQLIANDYKNITVALTGASGMPYAFRLIECLVKAGVQINLLISQAAQVVISMETDMNLPGNKGAQQQYLDEFFQAPTGQLVLYGHNEWTAPIASGSAKVDAMVICPCTSGTLSAVACGASNNLLERAADVMLKEKRPLIIVHRETPLSTIQIQNYLTLDQAGATILPANPGFYTKPKSIDQLIDFMVSRILDHLKVDNDLMKRWG